MAEPRDPYALLGVPPTGVAVAPLIPEDSPESDASAEPASEQSRIEARQQFLDTARARFHQVAEVEAELRRRMLEDLEFLQPGGQWPQNIRTDRDADGRPCLEVDRLNQPIKQVVNQWRQGRPSIQVNPVDSGSDPKTAEVFQGVIRHIEVSSDADVAYDTAIESAIKTGRGYWRVLTEYEDDSSFRQRLVIRRVRNPFSVYLDPSHQQFDGSDAQWGFAVEDITPEEYDRRFGTEDDPHPATDSLNEFTSAGHENQQDWFPGGLIRIANYYYHDDEQIALVDDPEAGLVEAPLAVVAKPGFPYRFRRLSKPRVKVALINATTVLEGNPDQTGGRDWPSRYVPLIPVYGDEVDINGVVDYQGIVRRAMDVARMGNYWKSAITETIALAPRAPFIGVEGQFETHETAWKLANRRNYAYLEYKPKSLGTEYAPPPQRQAYEPPIQAMTAALAQNENDLRAATGYVDVQATESRSETSGRAILARQKQSELGNSSFLDNGNRALKHTGRILLDMIPRVYDTPRVIRILGDDHQDKAVMVGAGLPQQMTLPPGVEQAFDLSAGQYDVTVSVGPSHESKRQDFVDAALALTQANPNIFGIAGDLIVREMDWPNADKIADRLAKALPPQLQDTPEGQPQIPPQMLAQMQQAQQVIDTLTQQVNELKDAEESKKLELASKERIAQIQADTQLAIAQAKATSANEIALLEARMEGIAQMVGIDMQQLGMNQQAQMAAQQQAHDAAMAEAGQVASANEAEAQRQFQAQEGQAQRSFQASEGAAKRDADSERFKQQQAAKVPPEGQ